MLIILNKPDIIVDKKYLIISINNPIKHCHYLRYMCLGILFQCLGPSNFGKSELNLRKTLAQLPVKLRLRSLQKIRRRSYARAFIKLEDCN